MESKVASYRHMPDRASADALAALLNDAGLSAEVVENSQVFDVTFTAGIEREYHVILPQEQFAQAETLLEAQAGEEVASLPADHYLRTFGEEELWEVLRKADEWSPHDRVLARELLRQQGHIVDERMMQRFRAERLESLARPEKATGALIAAGITMVLFGGVVGMAIGYSMAQARKTLPDGGRVPRYTPQDRRTGQYIMVAGAVFTAATIYLAFQGYIWWL